MIIDFINEVAKISSEEVIKIISKYYKQRPVLTTLSLIALIAAITSIIIGLQYLENKQEREMLVRTSFDQRVKKLDDVQNSLKELSLFIDSQRKDIAAENEIIQNLKKEKAQLEPVVNANREIVKKIFEIQERDRKYEFWLSLGLGFILGIIGTFITNTIDRAIKKAKTT